MARLDFLKKKPAPIAELTETEKAMKILNDDIVTGQKRSYLGMSEMGNPCHRALQYSHYGCIIPTHSSRIQRLFNVGHEAEEVLIEELTKIGINVFNQQKELVGKTGHVRGHIDGIGCIYNENVFECDGMNILVEFKTHNDKSFAELKRKKVKEAKPAHYDQMTQYAGYIGLKKSLYIALNKNTSEIYLEMVPFDEVRFDDLQRKEWEVITADTLLPRIGNDNPTWFECKLCSCKDVCFGIHEPAPDCRNCDFVDVLPNGEWYCSNENHKHNICDFRICDHYKLAGMFCD